jgi:hypothetical protein
LFLFSWRYSEKLCISEVGDSANAASALSKTALLRHQCCRRQRSCSTSDVIDSADTNETVRVKSLILNAYCHP